MADFTERLLEICALDGTSGDEGAVRDYIMAHITADEVTVDNLENLLVFKKGRKTPKNRIMFAAHMDEVGFMVTDITDEGFLRFGAVGGIDPRVVSAGDCASITELRVWQVPRRCISSPQRSARKRRSSPTC